MRRGFLSLYAVSTVFLVLAALAQVGDLRGRRTPGRARSSVTRFSEEEGISEQSRPTKEFTFARLVYSGGTEANNWTTDSPKADIIFAAGVKRLTNVNVRERPFFMPLDSKLLHAYPFLYAVEVGYMQLSHDEAAILREYLLRGGFFVVDDFHGTLEWSNFEEQIRKVFPDREVVEIPVTHPIFHCFFDINELIQIPGAQMLYTGRTYEKDGVIPHFRGIFDDRGRIMVMINFNSDLGDAWEWADVPYYPEKYASAALRLGVNYVIYSMTH
jgi:Domain of unknown function (DUF4159)